MGLRSWPDVARRVLQRWPAAERWGLGTLDLMYRVVLLPFRRPARRGSPREAAEIVARTDAYTQAAERYFAEFDNPQFLLDKPFGDLAQAPKHLIDAGVLIQALRLRRGDVVLELGAGSCWLSLMLNRCGSRTIAVDVSPTALALGRAAFERDPRADWSLDPQFLPYDGRRLPVDDESCDRVVVNDAFHHVPNQRELLLEMRRVLRADGLVAMSEPGRGHGTAEHSLEEAGSTGVLENELALPDLAALAEACGFEAVNVIVATPLVTLEVPARDLPAFMGGRRFARYWKAFCSALEQHHYIVLHKGSPQVTTRRPGRLSARFDMGSGTATARAGERLPLTLHVTNAGDTLWLSAEEDGPGWTRLGAHLLTATEPRQVIDFDWHRSSLPRDVAPGDRVRLDLDLPALGSPGTYVVVFDLVIEGVAWFADRGSPSATMNLRVA